MSRLHRNNGVSLPSHPKICFNIDPNAIVTEDKPLTEYLTEQEQVELLKKWIKQYSIVILAGVLLAVAAITGWRFWQDRQAKIYAHASGVYDEMLSMRAQNNQEQTLVQANKLFSHYNHTVYGQMAALMLARSATSKNDYPEAQKQLQWVMDNSDNASMQQIARLRLARLLITMNKPDESIKLLDTVNDEAFAGLIEEVKGDAYLAKKDIASARDAYALALKDLPHADVIRPLLQMKYDNLAINTTARAQ